jgi:bacillithiol biosynthesis deacetylase BshB1
MRHAGVKPVDILAISAHADDLELACGGTLIRAVDQGQRVGLLDLTRGEMGTRGTPRIRGREAEQARRLLGAAFRIQFDFGDGGLRVGRKEELELIRLIRKCRPAVVIAPYPDDRHPDHTRTGRLVTEASFYAGLSKLQTGQKAHRPQVVIYFLQNYVPHPTFVVDVTETFDRKMDAIASYKSQFHNPASNEPATFIARKSFLAMIEGRARHFGMMIGAEFGEAFVTKLPPRVDDLIAAYHGREVS